MLNTLEAQERLENIGQGIVEKKYQDGLWRVYAIGILEEIQITLDKRQSMLVLSYLDALRGYDAGGAFGLRMPRGITRLNRAWRAYGVHEG